VLRWSGEELRSLLSKTQIVGNISACPVICSGPPDYKQNRLSTAVEKVMVLRVNVLVKKPPHSKKSLLEIWLYIFLQEQ